MADTAPTLQPPTPPPNPSRRSRRTSLVSFPGVPSGSRPKSVHISAEEYKAITDLVELAKTFLAQQQTGSPGDLHASKPPDKDGPLDPFGANFDAREWAKSFYHLRSDSCEVRKAGVAFRKLSVSGYGSDTAFQSTVGNAWWLKALAGVRGLLGVNKPEQVHILQHLEGRVDDGEMLCVLGPPGSGCSTFLRTIAGDTHGTQVAANAYLNFRGVSADEMRRYFRGDAIYIAEEDVHFPSLSVADTLFFAARARAPKTPPGGLTTDEYARRVRDVTMAMLGIQHTMQTPVGGTDGVRGVSGGERKRVSIAEAALSFAPVQCWDNSTRGLDSGTTVEFCRTLRIQSDIMGMTSAVAIYQAPQEAYELFDKVLVLYEGRQIYFGKTSQAKRYFQRLGFVCPRNQTTPDFLTSMTSPTERIVKAGCQDKVPRTPDEFADAWRTSSYRHKLCQEIDAYDSFYSLSGSRTYFVDFLASKKSDQSSLQRWKSPYTISYPRQVMLCLWRALALLKAAPQMTIMMLIINLFQTIVVASLFFRLPNTAASMSERSTLLFTATLVNAFGCVLEVSALYAKRAVVEKHVRYAMYHASSEAIADLVMSLPYKLINAIIVNTIFYWMCNLRPEAAPFFFFLLVQFAMMLAVSLLFRFVASVTRSHTAAMAPSTMVLLALALYTGFTIPPMYYKPYAAWIAKLSPVAYGFEAVMINEFGDGRGFPCTAYVPSGPTYDDTDSMGKLSRVCAVQGAVAGTNVVEGSTYIVGGFGYQDSHRWRNVGLIFAFALAYFLLHLVATELVSSEKSKGEVLVFPKGAQPKVPMKRARDVEDHVTKERTTEAPPIMSRIPPLAPVPPVFTGQWRRSGAGDESPIYVGAYTEYNGSRTNYTAPTRWPLQDPRHQYTYQQQQGQQHNHKGDANGDLGIDRQTAIFHWRNVCYEVKVKDGIKRILDNVDGWCEPGTLTALMGVSGAGKTTLLDALASRLSTGVVTGEMLVDGSPRDVSFQQKTGYVKQQDQHMATSTVREALIFSAVLRQPAKFSYSEKIEYVDKVIDILGMTEYANAVIGVPGEGLNVEQRRRLTIGVELAARPALLLFLDEPTSGLDSQTSMSICNLLEKLRKNGQAILCTIHQPSAILFERFDRLLLLAPGGRTVYFGQIGRNANILVDYFVRNGGPQPKKRQNPAEYILEQVRAKRGVDWPAAWQQSAEYAEVKAHLARLKEAGRRRSRHDGQTQQQQQVVIDPPFAAPFPTQLSEVTRRVARHYWRTPSYIYAKVLLTIGSAVFIGLSLLNLPNTQAGITAQTIAVFMFLTTHLNLMQQILPVFVAQRTLYEEREQPSRTYSWAAFLGGQMAVEMAYNGLMSVPAFAAWYYLVGLNRNAAETNDTASRGVLALLFMLVFFLLASTFSHMIGAIFDAADQAAGIGNLLFTMMFIFNGILEAPPRFWVWMYRVNPFTYLVEGLLGTGLAHASIHCADNEFLHLMPPAGQTCGQYLQEYISQAGGYLVNPADTMNCSFCTTNKTDDVLAGVHVDFGHRWRDLGILFAYILFNAVAAFAFYWTRVPKPKKDSPSSPSQAGSSRPAKSEKGSAENNSEGFSLGVPWSKFLSSRSSQAMQAGKVLGSRLSRSSIIMYGGIGKIYWGDDNDITDGGQRLVIGGEEDDDDDGRETWLDYLSEGEEQEDGGDQDVSYSRTQVAWI
ncbi:Multidrug resistance protein [Gnomoniopsis sp. IMI 355080]|nr:Multidrug resistance protein [Gnomoniopsis sp. IMI 355080]